MAPYNVDDASNEIQDAQASMDPTRSECARPTILDHFNRYMRAKTMRDKYMELEGLISSCLAYVSDPRVAKEVEELMNDGNPNLSDDFITKRKDMWAAGVDWYTIEENEYRARLRALRAIWYPIHRDLARSGLLPWAMQYPDKILHGAFMQQVVDNIQTFNFEEEVPIKPRLPEPREPVRATPTDITERITNLLLQEVQPNPRNIVDMRSRPDTDIEPPVLSNAEPRTPTREVFVADLEQPPDDKISEDGPSDEVMDASAGAIMDFLAKRKKSVKHD